MYKLLVALVLIAIGIQAFEGVEVIEEDVENLPPFEEDFENELRIPPNFFDSKYNESRVNGGVPVNQIVPYQVSLQAYRRNRWHHFCGGSIITPYHVVTAAHCVDKMQPQEIHVVAGTLTWSKGGDRHRAATIRIHPQFTMSPKIINDVAIVKVSPAFNLHKPTISTIHLGSTNRIGEKVTVRVTGWGSVTPSASTGLPEKLQELRYQTISNNECARRGFRVTASEICALDTKGKGSCMGDSGGPLVTTRKPTQLVGIVSYGTVPCAQGIPDVYSRVSSFLPFINRVVANDIP
ncbi:chymotrypsin-2-like [Musca vetustissima]|uniref:chymotrypsin-2-like n=1 Tax=Musca vetustissima TaxID=27455 RepID=UPI002AB6BDEB|nr:chymotrypsin-2-like [Musca vetustissima]